LFNGLSGGVTLAAGSNITLTPAGNIITIAAAAGGGASGGVSSLNGLSGAINLLQGSNITIIAGAAGITISSSGGGGSGSPGGINKSIQYNNNGGFSGDSLFTYDPVSKTIGLGDLLINEERIYQANGSIPFTIVVDAQPLILQADVGFKYSDGFGISYAFPTTPGLNTQVLATDGVNQLSWENAVRRINGLSGGVTFAAGTNVTLSTTGNTITINSSGGGGGGGVNEDFVIAMAIALG
jgi:hypothetical protein